MKLFSCCSSRNELPKSLSADSYNANPEAIRLYCQADKLENSNKKNQKERITECYRQAAELGLRDAQRRMGIRIKDREERIKWFQLAADQGDKISKEFLNLFETLDKDEGVPIYAMTEPNFISFVKLPPGLFGPAE